MASGMPSSCAHSWAAADAVVVGDGEARLQRRGPVQQQPDGLVLAQGRRVCGTCARSGTDSGGTANRCSPVTPRVCRLVARMRTSPVRRSSSATNAAHTSEQMLAVVQHDQPDPVREVIDELVQRRLSSCGRSGRASSPPSAAPAPHRPQWTGRPSTRRPPKARRESLAASTASRVLPTPPTPVSVTNRDSDSRRRTSAISRRRPTKLVIAIGRFPAGRRRPAAEDIRRRYKRGFRRV